MGLLTAASNKLEQAADKIQDLADGLDATLENIELVRLDCQNNAQLLSELKNIEDEIDALTGGAEVGTLLAQVGEMTDITEELTQTIGVAMEAFLEPESEVNAGGPRRIPDSGFDRWLNSRSQ